LLAQLRALTAAEQQNVEVREKLQAQLKRSEEQAARLLAERDAAAEARDKHAAALADAKVAAADAAGRAAHTAELTKQLEQMRALLDEARAGHSASAPTLSPTERLGGSTAIERARAGASEGRASDDAAMAKEHAVAE
jgi:hypothetical protein